MGSPRQHHLPVPHRCLAVNFLEWVVAREKWPKEKAKKAVGTWGNLSGELGEREGCVRWGWWKGEGILRPAGKEERTSFALPEAFPLPEALQCRGPWPSSKPWLGECFGYQGRVLKSTRSRRMPPGHVCLGTGACSLSIHFIHQRLWLCTSFGSVHLKHHDLGHRFPCASWCPAKQPAERRLPAGCQRGGETHCKRKRQSSLQVYRLSGAGPRRLLPLGGSRHGVGFARRRAEAGHSSVSLFPQGWIQRPSAPVLPHWSYTPGKMPKYFPGCPSCLR